MKSEMILKLMCVMFAESGLKTTEIPCSTWNYFHLMLFQNKNYMYECMCAYIPLKKKVCKLIIQLHTLGNQLWRFCFPSVMAILGRPLEMHGKRGPQWRYCRLRFACRHICGGVSWLLIDGGGLIPLWTGGPGLCKETGWAESVTNHQAAFPHGSFLCSCLGSYPDLHQWWTVWPGCINQINLFFSKILLVRVLSGQQRNELECRLLVEGAYVKATEFVKIKGTYKPTISVFWSSPSWCADRRPSQSCTQPYRLLVTCLKNGSHSLLYGAWKAGVDAT